MCVDITKVSEPYQSPCVHVIHQVFFHIHFVNEDDYSFMELPTTRLDLGGMSKLLIDFTTVAYDAWPLHGVYNVRADERTAEDSGTVTQSSLSLSDQNPNRTQ